jgi:tetratricopeptide (TPR) repeat protein
MFMEAVQAYQNALNFDDGNVGAYRGLAICYLRLQKYEEAAEYALSAISLFFNMPLAHYHLGEALFYLKKYGDSAQAFELALKMAPDLFKARLRLVKIYLDHLNEPAKAEIHSKILSQFMKGEITIVSGLPRSGTSMLMQMLQAGGLDILTDNVRQPDENNPKGYLEYTPVKNLKKDQSFLAEADGKVVKVITQLLKYLPDQFIYKVIFVKRNMHEILASQQKMIGKAGDTYSVSLAQAFEREVELVDIWARKEPNVEIKYLNYEDVIFDTDAQIASISGFIGKDLDKNKMKAAVNINLYRNRLSKKS